MERLSTLHIAKERHKFSAAHFTIFTATERERLHGHNYAVSARIVAAMGDNGFAADYNVYKDRLQQLCDALDEYLLLPARSPHLQIVEDGINYRVQYDQDVMQFLRKDTIILPVCNVTIEELAFYLLDQLRAACGDEDVRELELAVSSGAGQSASALWQRAG
jgi:6-pyruvoyltetrahydropterin/6-carboxytetrahydropterin synthase